MSFFSTKHIEFITIPQGIYELGWHYNDQISAKAKQHISNFLPMREFTTRFSTHRQVDLVSFSIASTALSVEAMVNYYLSEEQIKAISTITVLCDMLDDVLKPRGLRIPTEDEFEVACGGGLFPWGMEIPDGIPYQSETTFQQHKKPNKYGLLLNANPYSVALVKDAFKLGDGGEAICGGYPWPIAWFALASSWSLSDREINDCLSEFIEEAYVHLVHDIK